MSNLGNLGTVKAPADDTFGWFGAEIHVHPRLTDLVLMDFAEQAEALDETSPEVMTFLKRQLRSLIAPQDFDAFWQGALDNAQDSTDLMVVMKAIVENSAARPTVLPSDSSGGQPRAVVTSPDVSSWPDTVGSPLAVADRQTVDQETLELTRAKLLQFRDEAYGLKPSDRRTIEAQPGRPDLNLFVVRSSEERTAAS